MPAPLALADNPAPRIAQRVRTAFVVLSLGCAVAAANAQAPADLGQATQQWLDAALQQQSQGMLRMEVSVGALDERLRLAPCARIEPYLPAGARLWGRSRLGLRCVEGSTRWNVFLPLTVKAFGPAWVLTGNVASGEVLTEADATETEVDWAAEAASVVADPAQWVGQVASRPLHAGQALRQSMVRAPHLFQAGAQVRVVAEGPGYAVSGGGQALVAGAAGQTVRVRMGNGKIVSGTVDENGTVTAQF
ncbi:flagella basal body P-ring formation protein FlgA [Rhodococcus sp. SRB_17]|uniref:flagellar basal body P-ring formation chaperone FlgA n=1 Tax=Acidovorax sp. SRB_24 TaxID=1962700 RepID=UPI00145FB17F|nr:flagellar basal body P-ring formation chaperone FlgA [Acidovorax sp. SRB_24]NMM77246.1 flagella basal body P-ring formation protein FlgA [Acidovorax sp. SRB_24]NMM85405.1 flagella basal body P-ring formation protein FlgA [Rhodococcus sp. SRB_17]